MTAYNPAMQKASFEAVEPDVHGRISKRTAHLDGVAVTRVTFDVGARWSADLKDHAGTDDGGEEDFAAGQGMLLAPGHGAWSVGDRPCTFVEFSRGNDYYAGVSS